MVSKKRICVTRKDIWNSGCPGLLRVTLFIATLLIPLLAAGCGGKENTNTKRPSAISGTLQLNTERPILDVSREQAAIFQTYYPDTRISVNAVAPEHILSSLLNKQAGAVLVCGSLSAGEDSLLLDKAWRGRKEPVARDAVICIVNRRSAPDSLSTSTIAMMLSGKLRSAGDLVPLITENNYRLLLTLRDQLHIEKSTIHALQAPSDSLLAVKTASDTGVIGLLFLSSYNELALPAHIRDLVRIVPVLSDEQKARATLPSEQHIFDGTYPLATIVHYIYLSGNPLAAGLGSWLSKDGQKGFERSYLAPFRQVPRTIILK
ncbi:MAG: substrate-binding domain-containing protein [Chlorobium sp.]|jgi:phosphate transport system substrate-binding protein|uniref:substrate-binding domain-containing protein n=1 Tax=Chlorobium sp. TaxID=1095 RepID=UPI0025C36607|nr:substrate-binding domain-containing protein [Chlorobium sp.]MCF8216802.1 substrate-binding domain-containing protein [Chlorobium sp.]MCF8271553.1 substrate-binding domain-containing protein [Chlorobium sp.]MCF8287925.1 substrate-binding domain-containing protein [Chlorobium sp.]MCF8291603.1 substrate-binding domain-containing protein [Chlorobium sp.]MCF8385594.1 substrate-binding domain-containing protein [Chlorobium sp.]